MASAGQSGRMNRQMRTETHIKRRRALNMGGLLFRNSGMRNTGKGKQPVSGKKYSIFYRKMPYAKKTSS
jgi:hypothetical protein